MHFAASLLAALGPAASEPILNALERGDGNRLTRTLHDLVAGLMPSP